LGKGLVAAKVAFKAWDMVMQGHALANGKTTHKRSNFNDNTRRFMPKNARRRDSAVVNLFNVRGANPASGHLDQKIGGLDAGDGERFQSKVIRPAINDRRHVFGNQHQIHSHRLTQINTDKTQNPRDGIQK
jgi:hypothetical protein